MKSIALNRESLLLFCYNNRIEVALLHIMLTTEGKAQTVL